MSDSLNKKIKTATKWSTVGEIAAKLVTPISSMVLARLLTPDAFGVVTTLTMIITFAEIFTDAGFQKYLVQHDGGALEGLFYRIKADDGDESFVGFPNHLLSQVFLRLGILVVIDEVI